jgi:hypothetical protein
MRERIVPSAVVLVLLALGFFTLLRAQPAAASRFCGTFHEAGLLTTVQVYGNHYVGCDQAVNVMKRRFNGDSPSGWSCIGPQTGYAKCTKARKRVAHF